MTPKFVYNYLKDCHYKLLDLSRKGEGNIIYLWYDFLTSSLIHGAIINHYTRGQLYKLKGCERGFLYHDFVSTVHSLMATGLRRKC